MSALAVTAATSIEWYAKSVLALGSRPKSVSPPSWPPSNDTMAQPAASGGELPGGSWLWPVAATTEPPVPPWPWKKKRPFHLVGTRSSNMVP